LAPEHDLLPDPIVRRIPHLEAESPPDCNDPVAWVKWSSPDSLRQWYVTAYDRVGRHCFGLVVFGTERSFADFSLVDVQKFRGPLEKRVERDVFFTPRPISKCIY
jgi:hypothetical protein